MYHFPEQKNREQTDSKSTEDDHEEEGDGDTMLAVVPVVLMVTVLPY